QEEQVPLSLRILARVRRDLHHLGPRRAPRQDAHGREERALPGLQQGLHAQGQHEAAPAHPPRPGPRPHPAAAAAAALHHHHHYHDVVLAHVRLHSPAQARCCCCCCWWVRPGGLGLVTDVPEIEQLVERTEEPCSPCPVVQLRVKL
ncbi:hypothetical protein LOZ56_000475, partial [Ophidiomyces ophidiicola]